MEKKISFLLVITILFGSFYPGITFAEGNIKEIYAIFNGMNIEVNNKKIITNKEPIIYDDLIWISINDLAKGLGLSINSNDEGKVILLDSKGKLTTNFDKSKAPISYQRGYEIEAKEKRMKEIEKELDYLEKGKLYKNPENSIAHGKERNIRVYFGDVEIFLDGKKLNLNLKPFLYENEVYVSIENLSKFLYVTPSYDENNNILNIDTNGILLNKEYYSNLDSLSLVRNNRNYLLELQLAELEKRKSIIKDLKIPYKKIKDIKDLEEYLNKYLCKLGDIDTKIEVDASYGKWIHLDISFSSSKTGYWYKLQRIDVEDWMWNIYSAILNLYDEENLIYGNIRNPYYSKNSNSNYKNYVTFDMSDKNLFFDFSKSNLKKGGRIDPIYLVDTLDKNINKYNNINFSYIASTSGEDIDLICYADSNDFSSWHQYTKLSYLRKLNMEIRKVYPDIKINGKIFVPDGDKEPLRFLLEKNQIYSMDLLPKIQEY